MVRRGEEGTWRGLREAEGDIREVKGRLGYRRLKVKEGRKEGRKKKKGWKV